MLPLNEGGYVYIMASGRNGTLYKKWNRLWKLSAIEQMNPDWQDLYPTLI